MPYKDLEVRKQKSAERWQKWAENNREKANARMRNWRHRNPKYMLFISAKRRAEKEGTPFEIVIDDIPDIPTNCPITGIVLAMRNDGSKGPIDSSPTLDRVNPVRGYTPTNIQIISYKANRWKSNMTLYDINCIMEYMIKYS